jgi:hypothetical protein
VEEGPTTVAALVQVVAHHEVLRRQNWNLLSISLLESRLDHLSEGNGVARSAGALVS